MAKTILITGASSGIGAATARHLATGNEIIVHYNSSQAAAEEVAAAVNDAGGRSHVVQANLATEDGCRRAVSFAADHCGKLDVLVNSAGGLIRRQAAGELEWQLIYDHFALNTFSAMQMSSLCVSLLEKGENSCIVNLTSIAVRHGAPTATIYGAAKGALDAFTRGLAKELAPTIRAADLLRGRDQHGMRYIKYFRDHTPKD